MKSVNSMEWRWMFSLFYPWERSLKLPIV